jgi:Fe(3+) dicitrate transport protein
MRTKCLILFAGYALLASVGRAAAEPVPEDGAAPGAAESTTPAEPAPAPAEPAPAEPAAAEPAPAEPAPADVAPAAPAPAVPQTPAPPAVSATPVPSADAAVGETIEIEGRAPASPPLPADHAGTFHTVSRAEIERTRAADTGEVLRRVPGVVYVDEDGRGFKPDIGMRGQSPHRSRNVLLLMDGAPIQPSMYGDPSTYYNPPIERIERIDVIKGGAGLLYGANTVGGVVNYVTRRPPDAPLAAALRLSYGSHDAVNGDASLGGRSGALHYGAYYLHKQGDGFRENLDYDVDGGGLELEAALGGGSSLSFSLDGHREVEGTSGGLAAAQYAADPSQTVTPNDRFEGRRVSGDVTYRRPIGNGTLEAKAYANFLERNWFIAGTMTDGNDQFRRKFDVFGLEPRYTLDYDVGPLAGNRLTVGARVHVDRMTDRNVRGASPTARTGTTAGNAELGTLAYAAYAVNEIAVTDRIKITPGLRGEWIDMRLSDFVAGTRGSSSERELIPALGASVRVAPETFVFASVERSFRPAAFKEAIDPTTGAERALDAQRSIGFDVGARTAALDWLAGEVSLFHVDFDNQVINSGGMLTNAQDTFHRGVEGSLRVGITDVAGLRRRDVGDVSVRYAVTLLDTGFTRGPFDGKRLPFAPRQQHVWTLAYAHDLGIDASVDGRFVGEQFADGANTRAENEAGTLGVIPSYLVWDANLSYRWRELGTVFVSGKNVLDERYFTFRGSLAGSPGIFPSPGRIVMAGITVTY